MAATQWEFPTEGNLRVPINLDSDSYIVAAGETGITQVKNTNLNGYWAVPEGSEDYTTEWGRTLQNLLYVFGIESDLYVSGTETEYNDVQFTITLKDQTVSTEGQ